MFVRKNDRKSTRHHVRIDCQVVRETDFSLVGHRTLDLSADGMLVRTARRTPGTFASSSLPRALGVKLHCSSSSPEGLASKRMR